MNAKKYFTWDRKNDKKEIQYKEDVAFVSAEILKMIDGCKRDVSKSKAKVRFLTKRRD